MDEALMIEVDIEAPPEIVFEFLNNPRRVTAWLGNAALSHSGTGGALEIKYPNGDIMRGAIVAATHNRQITYSWGYEDSRHGLAPGSSRVTITLTPTVSGTHLVLRHDNLTPTQSDAHRIGWMYYTATLARVAGDEAILPTAIAAVDAYFEAWRETDPTRRAEALLKCWSENGNFIDKTTTAVGRQALTHHIAMAQQYAPGLRLARDGDVIQCQRHVHFAWAALMNGIKVAHGVNFGTLSREGKFDLMVGFADPA